MNRTSNGLRWSARLVSIPVSVLGALVLTSLMSLWSVASAQSINLMDGNPKNGLSSRSFLRNSITTNPAALSIVTSMPLSNDLLAQPYIHLQLNDVRGRAVMHEMVKCALAPSRSLTYTDAAGASFTWQGELGLCQRAGTDVGDWSVAPPTVACQEVVTACLMARVNANAKSVPISLRGEPAEMFPHRPVVATENTMRERRDFEEDPTEGTPIDSFFGPLCLAGHECMWAQAYVGRCNGGTIKLAISSDQCATTPIRVCAGIHGCYGPDSPVGYPSTVDYSKIWAAANGACTATPLTFTCPLGTDFNGFFSVMTRPPRGGGLSRVRPPSPPITRVFGDAIYPANEEKVFPYLEGAFWGNLFEANQLTRICQVFAATPNYLYCMPTVPGGLPPTACPASSQEACNYPLVVPYRNVYACYAMSAATTENEAVAYMNDRLCATEADDVQCFPHPPQRCEARCTWNASTRQYENCAGLPDAATGAVRWYSPITTYLNGPCDLLFGQSTCRNVWRWLRVIGGPL